jgi:hypothetical protein
MKIDGSDGGMGVGRDLGPGRSYCFISDAVKGPGVRQQDDLCLSPGCLEMSRLNLLILGVVALLEEGGGSYSLLRLLRGIFVPHCWPETLGQHLESSK